MIWDEDSPGDVLANTIHTEIQNTKSSIMERLRLYNGSNYEHDVFGGSASGRHELSLVGVAKINNSSFSLGVWFNQNHPADGCILIDKSTNTLYLADDGIAKKVSTTDHGSFLNLSGDDHTQYMKKDGSREATADWNLTDPLQLRVSTFGEESSDIMSSDHANLGWYAAHGANSIWQRHFADQSISISVLKYTTHVASSYSTVLGVNLDTTLDRWSGFPAAAGTSSTTPAIGCYYTAGSPRYVFTQYGFHAVAWHRVYNGAST